MCGITGVVSINPIDRAAVEKITLMLAHRGPDAQAVYLTPEQTVALGHRRLSIIDLRDAANQPMHSPTGRYTLVFNGEIYNYEILKKELQARGTVFKTTSDTEVLLAAYEAWGKEALNRLEGMFALAIYDHRNRSLFLARDRVGKKPLYYYQSQNLFVFASEPKAILAYPACKPKINTQALLNFLQLGYIPEPLTAWQNIHKLPAACWGVVTEPGKIQINSYWSINGQVNYDVEEDEIAVTNRLSELLSNAVKKRLRSDVPLGALLSGGTDSSVVCALANEHLKGKLKTFNIAFTDAQFNESKYAERVARVLGTDHHTFSLTAPEAVGYMHKYLGHFDEPFADTSAIPTLMVSEKTRQQVTVALTGDGGDELFLGYGSYRWAERIATWQWAGKAMAPLLSKMPRAFSKAGQMLQANSPQEIFTIEQGFFTNTEMQKLSIASYSPFQFLHPANSKAPAERQALFDFNYYLPDDLLVKVDRASMYYGLECRCPLLDHEVAAYAFALPMQYKMRGRVQKYLLKKLLERYLPHELVHRPKWGFGVPLESWLRTDLAYLIEEYLNSEIVNRYALVHAKEVNKLVTRFNTGESGLYHRIWVLIALHFWLTQHAR
ncbi:MAG: asparagine synthase (glutamine-hydrolyzing) [Cyclobacteriaceae bacterium]|nr:asparagine synthase (glutamine-hydrolyzing) [Cyclobacteriaceae bacterium]